jgi:hypothetical protein
LQTFIKPELNQNYDQNIPKLNELQINQAENEFNQKHGLENCSNNINNNNNNNDIKLLQLITKKLKTDIDHENNILIESPTLPTDTSALFISKLTDTPIVNSDDNDEQLILVNKKPAANKEFLDKLNDCYKRETQELKENLEILRENFEQIQKNSKKDFKLFENLVSSLNQQILNEKLKKKLFYKNLIENLFSKKIVENDTEDAADLDDEKLDNEFYLSLKENLLKLRETYDHTVEDTRKTMDSLKINFAADKQKCFNEAIERVSKDKDRQIEELKSVQLKLNVEIEQLKQKIVNDGDKEDALQRSLMKQHKLIERVQYLEQQLSKGKGTLVGSPSTNAITQQPHSGQASACDIVPSPMQNPLVMNKYQPLTNAIQLNS